MNEPKSAVHWEGNDWEDFVHSALYQRYPPGDYQKVPAKHTGDFGIEGYGHPIGPQNHGTVFQCYAAESYWALETDSLYEKNRDKIGRDIKKFRDNKHDIEKLLGKLTVDRWVFFAPQFTSAKLAQYTTKKENEVLEEDLPYVADEFAITVANESAFDESVRRQTLKTLEEIRVNLPDVTDEEIEAWEGKKKDGKDFRQNIVKKSSSFTHSQQMKREFIRGVITRQHLKRMLAKQFPELQNHISDVIDDVVRRINRNILLNPGWSAEEVCSDAREVCERRLRNNFGNLPEEARDKLSWGTISWWVAKCALNFDVS